MKSPLRYPGGKAKLYPIILDVFEKNKIKNPIFIEPFAGGAGLGLKLLGETKFRELKINDINKGVVAFWYCTTQRTDELIRLIETTEVNIKKAKEIKAFYIEYRNQEITTMHKDLILKLGFSFFYLNRVNFSGIIQAGIIGGNEQKSEYNISCRFNKQILIERIKEISLKKAQIKVTNTDELIYSYSPYHRNQFKIQKI